MQDEQSHSQMWSLNTRLKMAKAGITALVAWARLTHNRENNLSSPTQSIIEIQRDLGNILGVLEAFLFPKWINYNLAA